MTPSVAWYRSSEPPPAIHPTLRRRIRDLFRSALPEPDVRGRTMVLHSRRTFPRLTRHGLRSDFHGVFSEFHSVLGGLAYAETHGAAAVRVSFESPLYVEPDRGPNWWSYYFEKERMSLGADPKASDVHLDAPLSKYGRHGGFADIVQGSTPYLYPMTYGLGRETLHRLVREHVPIRQEIVAEVGGLVASLFTPAAFVVGVHYRGTDATHGWTGALNHYRTEPVPYLAYAEEVRRALQGAGAHPWQVFVATDEIDFLEFMQREFGTAVCHFNQSPRVRADSQAVHLDLSLPVSKYQKGKSALVDALLLAATSYLIKGRSNLSDASLVFNPSLPYSFCPDVTAFPV